METSICLMDLNGPEQDRPWWGALFSTFPLWPLILPDSHRLQSVGWSHRNGDGWSFWDWTFVHPPHVWSQTASSNSIFLKCPYSILRFLRGVSCQGWERWTVFHVSRLQRTSICGLPAKLTHSRVAASRCRSDWKGLRAAEGVIQPSPAFEGSS